MSRSHPALQIVGAIGLAAALVAATPSVLLGQTANQPATLDEPGPPPEQPEPAVDPAAALEARLAGLIDPHNRPRAEPGGEAITDQLDAIATEAQRLRAEVEPGGETVETRRRLATLELRARHALVAVASAEGGAFRASLRSSQLRAAASRLADASDPGLAGLGHYFLAAAELGELTRDPGDDEIKRRVASVRLTRLREPDAVGLGEGQAMAFTPAIERAAVVASALLAGRSGQSAEDSGLIRRAAAMVEGRPELAAALERFARRAALLDAETGMVALLGDAAPVNAEGRPAALTVVHYFQAGVPGSLSPLFELRRLYRDFDAQALEIVSVSVGLPGDWPEEASWPLHVARGAGGLGLNALAVEATPTFAVFDAEGRLILTAEHETVLAEARRRLNAAVVE